MLSSLVPAEMDTFYIFNSKDGSKYFMSVTSLISLQQVILFMHNIVHLNYVCPPWQCLGRGEATWGLLHLEKSSNETVPFATFTFKEVVNYVVAIWGSILDTS